MVSQKFKGMEFLFYFFWDASEIWINFLINFYLNYYLFFCVNLLCISGHTQIYLHNKKNFPRYSSEVFWFLIFFLRFMNCTKKLTLMFGILSSTSWMGCEKLLCTPVYFQFFCHKKLGPSEKSNHWYFDRSLKLFLNFLENYPAEPVFLA